jgi:HK97 family phage major capsid protein
MKLTLVKPFMGHQPGEIDILDDAMAAELVRNGYAKEPAKDPIQSAVDAAAESLGSRVDAALERYLQKFAAAQTKSRKNGIPEIFGPNGNGEPKRTFSAFLKAIRLNDRKALEEMGSEWEPWTKTAMSTTSGPQGGFLIPTEHYPQIMEYVIDASIIRKHATIIPQGSRETQVPAIDVSTVPTAGNNAMLGGVVFNWTEDSANETETEPNLKQIRLINYELTGYSFLSNTLMEDAESEGLEALITMIFGTGVGWTEDYAFFAGNGAGKPLGILNWKGLIQVTRSGASAFALVDLAGMQAQLVPTGDPEDRFWACSPSVLLKIYQLVAGNVAYFSGDFQQANVSKGAGGNTYRMLAGMPLYVTDKLPALDTVGDILLCQGDAYLIGDRKTMSIAYSVDARFTNNQTVWRVVHRVAGRPWPETYTTLPDTTSTVSPFVALSHV